MKIFLVFNLLLKSITLLVMFGLLEAKNVTIPALFAFGDSILDTGNNNNLPTTSKCNFPPYGRDFNGGIPTGRFGNGRVLSDLIASGLQIKESLPAFMNPLLQEDDIRTGVCFASGGSGLDSVTANIQGVIWVPDQVKMFKQYTTKLKRIVGKTESKKIISNSIFLLSAANNDIAITYFSTPTRRFRYDVSAYSNLLTGWTTTFLQDLYNLGARKFIVLSTLPLGCLPGARLVTAQMCNEIINGAAQNFNEKLSQKISSLQTTLPKAKLMYFDVYTPLLQIIKNPQQFGFQFSRGGCCCTPTAIIPCFDDSQFVFWDYAHPTEKAYKVIAPMIIQSYREKFL